jgi:hypothetical protein
LRRRARHSPAIVRDAVDTYIHDATITWPFVAGSHYPKNGSAAIEWRIGSGWSVNPVCGEGSGEEWLASCGKVWLASQPVSRAGTWIVVDDS